MLTRNAVFLSLCLTVLTMNSVTSFTLKTINGHQLLLESSLQISPRPSASMLYASAYDQDEGFQVEKESKSADGEVSSDKKEKVSQIISLAVGAFFSYSILMVALSTASFVSGSVSQAFDIGNIANFVGTVVGTVAGATWSGLKVAAPVVGKGVMSAGQAAAPYVQEASQKVSEVAAPLVQEAAQKVSEAASPVVEQAAQAVNEAASPYVSAVDSTINNAASAVDSTINSATSAVTSTLDAKLVAPIKDATDSVISTVDSTVKTTTDSVVTAVDSSIKEAAGSVSSTLKGVTDGAMESIKQSSPF